MKALVAMSMDSELQKHYAQLLGIGSPWEVKTVELKLAERKVEIELGWQWGAAAKCPECGRECSIHDCAPERTWRHLDTMQFTTLIRARTPRANCPDHGVKTMLKGSELTNDVFSSLPPHMTSATTRSRTKGSVPEN